MAAAHLNIARCSGAWSRHTHANGAPAVPPSASHMAAAHWRAGARFGAWHSFERQHRCISVIANGANSSLPKHQTWLAQGHADAPDSPFHELRLSEAERNAGGAIGRRNYSFLLSPDGQQPAVTVDWASIFHDPTKPLVVDLGCGPGRYVLLMAVRKGPGKNYLGVDVHKALLDRANGWAAARSLSGHVHYLQANAVVSAGALLGSYPGPVELVSIQYPDPQQRRQRHIVGRELVEALAAVLQPGARVYLASDFEDTAAFMRNAFERHGSGAFRVDDVHANQPVFPCTPAAAVAAAAVATSGGRKSSPEAIGSTSEAEETRPSSSEAGGAVRPTSSASSLPGGVETTSGSGQPEGASERGASAGVVDEDDLLWFQGSWERAGWLVENPVGAPTEREVYQMATKGPVYRALLVRM